MPTRKNNLVAPVVKWVGGKRQLIAEIEQRLPPCSSYTTYYEPFCGGGAVLFHRQPKHAVVSDINGELINLYQMIQTNVDGLITELRKHKNDEAHYYEIRQLDRDKKRYGQLTPVQKAARLVFLNKTCYNGLFRVNGAGEFNSPFGRYKNPNIVDEAVLRAVHNYVSSNNITFRHADYEEVLSDATQHDFVYLDPPYDPVSHTASFTGYDKGGFDQDAQSRLKQACDALDKRGVKFLLSNSATDFIKTLYASYKIDVVPAKRFINSVAEKRGDIDEVLVRNY
ncbi:MAG: DNA adenine methylase [Thermoguttaceae bacterium]